MLGNDVVAHSHSRTLKQQMAILASALLLLTIGRCVLQSASGCFESSDQGMLSGLCAGMVVILASVLLLPSPGITGQTLIRRRHAFTAIFCDLLDRPPRSFCSLAVPPVRSFCRAF
jgi:hypothetical protein